ncbi:NAD(P)-dependent dehydrogenase (short-subunit alcohol dehydrogenase family) [Sphaerotilus hippei]|uniref:NAD(P)-dependent dehydrogenase (Short-subunit alcohol dehydrogenase family) n=1 Tax=Sphaerotilus hippei TaxID=744406 RepID=A0A318H2W7_9BURK|nr:SDR family oxidoreductase [Sphaerotilus hippei]PXW97583.1 NAD(P)-dependent dehydrogenase (short-subunit alcohol dehydrogenase family) [Sphaerotilus hippei]
MTSVFKPALPGRRGDRLAGKVAVVTGIAAGIGRTLALMFAQQGARVVGADLDAAGAQATLDEAAAQGLLLHSLHPLDLTRPDAVQRLVEHAVALHGGLDLLVNAAAFGAFAWIESMDYEQQWRRTLTGEVDIVFLACQAAWPHLKARGGGAVINFASANAHMALPLLPAVAHCAGKGAVLAMSRQLAMEGGPHGIRVNTISPALVVTAATRQPLEQLPGFEAQVLGKFMVRRLGQPEDIGWAAIYLASDESSWVTGADFHIDAGATAW